MTPTSTTARMVKGSLPDLSNMRWFCDGYCAADAGIYAEAIETEVAAERKSRHARHCHSCGKRIPNGAAGEQDRIIQISLSGRSLARLDRLAGGSSRSALLDSMFEKIDDCENDPRNVEVPA